MGGDLYKQEQLPLTFFFSIYHLWKGFFTWKSWLHLQPMGLDLQDIVLALHSQVMMWQYMRRCLCVDLDRSNQYVFVVVVANSFHMFKINELEEAWLSKWIQVWEFKMCSLLCKQRYGCSRHWLTFTLVEIDELVLLMVATIAHHAQSISEHHIQVLN